MTMIISSNLEANEVAELNLLCAQKDPDMTAIFQKVRGQPSLLFPPVQDNEEYYTPYTFPLQQAASMERDDTAKDLELFKFLLEEGLKLSLNESAVVFDHIQKGGLIVSGRPKSEPYPLTTL